MFLILLPLVAISGLVWSEPLLNDGHIFEGILYLSADASDWNVDRISVQAVSSQGEVSVRFTYFAFPAYNTSEASSIFTLNNSTNEILFSDAAVVGAFNAAVPHEDEPAVKNSLRVFYDPTGKHLDFVFTKFGTQQRVRATAPEDHEEFLLLGKYKADLFKLGSVGILKMDPKFRRYFLEFRFVSWKLKRLNPASKATKVEATLLRKHGLLQINIEIGNKKIVSAFTRNHNREIRIADTEGEGFLPKNFRHIRPDLKLSDFF